jgi:hypothetical protein
VCRAPPIHNIRVSEILLTEHAYNSITAGARASSERPPWLTSRRLAQPTLALEICVCGTSTSIAGQTGA